MSVQPHPSDALRRIEEAYRGWDEANLNDFAIVEAALSLLAERLREAEAQRDEINHVLTGLTRIGLTEPDDHVFRFFQRLHGLPETGAPSGPTWKERAVKAEEERDAARAALRAIAQSDIFCAQVDGTEDGVSCATAYAEGLLDGQEPEDWCPQCYFHFLAARAVLVGGTESHE